MATPFPFFSWLPWIFVVVQRLLLLQSTGSLAHGLKSCGSGASLSYGKWDLCSLTRDRTHVPCIGRHWKVDDQGNPYSLISAGYFQQQSSIIFSFPGSSAQFLYPHPAPNSHKVGLLFSRLVMSDSMTSWPAACQASLPFTISWSLLKLMSILLTDWLMYVFNVDYFLIFIYLSASGLSRVIWASAAPANRLSSLTRDWTQVPCIARQILNHWTTKQVPWLNICYRQHHTL